MGAAMLLKTVRYGVPFGTGNRWLKMCTQRSQAQLLLHHAIITRNCR